MLAREKIEEIIVDFFNQAGFAVDINLGSMFNGECKVLIKSRAEQDSQFLIGREGKNLTDWQKIINQIIRRKTTEPVFLFLDVNGYRESKEQYLKDLAQETANQVVSRGKEKILFPMPSFERKVIHLELSNRNDIQTESMGSNDDRRIVIKPKEK